MVTDAGKVVREKVVVLPYLVPRESSYGADVDESVMADVQVAS
jgi:hypothetical protein